MPCLLLPPGDTPSLSDKTSPRARSFQPRVGRPLRGGNAWTSFPSPLACYLYCALASVQLRLLSQRPRVRTLSSRTHCRRKGPLPSPETRCVEDFLPPHTTVLHCTALHWVYVRACRVRCHTATCLLSFVVVMDELHVYSRRKKKNEKKELYLYCTIRI